MNQRTEADISHRMAVGSKLRSLREEAGFTVRELAEKAGVTAANITNIENGKYSVGLDVLARIAGSLGATVEIMKAAE